MPWPKPERSHSKRQPACGPRLQFCRPLKRSDDPPPAVHGRLAGYFGNISHYIAAAHPSRRPPSERKWAGCHIALLIVELRARQCQNTKRTKGLPPVPKYETNPRPAPPPEIGPRLRRYRRRSLGGSSEQASITADIGKLSVLATFARITHVSAVRWLHHAGKRNSHVQNRRCASKEIDHLGSTQSRHDREISPQPVARNILEALASN